MQSLIWHQAPVLWDQMGRLKQVVFEHKQLLKNIVEAPIEKECPGADA
jgi:hypothetical protein